MTGATPDKSTDGISFAATLQGKPQTARPFLYREFAGYGGWRATWVGDYKLVQSNMHKKVVTELYDLSKDPSEANDLAKSSPAEVAKLMTIVKREHVPSTVFPLKAIDG